MIHAMFRQVTLLWLLLCVPLAGVAQGTGHSDSAARMVLKVGPRVVHCAAGPVGDARRLRAMLRQGASVTVRWEFTIARVREFWLDDDAGEVVVTRVVKSDLISRSWQLRDLASGVRIETDDPDRAVRFLTMLEDFPLIDRALLLDGATYEVRLKLHVREGDQPQAWWQRWVDFGKTVAVGRFSLRSAGR